MNKVISNHQDNLIVQAINQIEGLRKTLKVLYKLHPDITEQNLRNHWEFWTTDEILEIISDELYIILKND